MHNTNPIRHMLRFASYSSAIWLACTTLSLVRAQQDLPYKPTYLLNGPSSQVYQLSPDSAQFSVYNVADRLSANDEAEVIDDALPFLTDASLSFVPVAANDGLMVFAGQCAPGEQELDLWSYSFAAGNQSWSQMHTTAQDQNLAANWLSAAFTFPSAGGTNSDNLYVFGGMCSTASNKTTSWTQNATYSNTLLAISPDESGYDVALTGTRSPPIAEAGLSITALKPTSFSTNDVASQQNFVLLGGHTQNAFINMSQVAMFSMPEQSWAFIGIQQSDDVTVEPRSGHTAVLSEDGSKIFVYGGWVGTVSNPASPQLAILQVGQGYGGNGSWMWSLPDDHDAQNNPGIYGHGATMLPGDIMMVSGGHTIESSAAKKRSAQPVMFYNTRTATWSSNYANPNAPKLDSSTKTGLGVGLGVGTAAVVMVTLILFIYARRRRQRRREREQYLRNLAMGTHEDFPVVEVPRNGVGAFFVGRRSASWGTRQEDGIQSQNCRGSTEDRSNQGESAANVWLNIPDPERQRQNSLQSRGPPGFGSNYAGAPGGVFTIEEAEERSERGSIRRPDTSNSRPLSDPFKDPPKDLSEEAVRRRKEVETWVDDWQHAAESMNLSRSTSKANSRTYSSLSAYHSASSGNKSDKSDRTNSDLSERSNLSGLTFKKSVAPGVARSASQSHRASLALFSSAAAAMGRLAGRSEQSTVEQTGSKRVVSQGDLTQMAARKHGGHIHQDMTTPIFDPSLHREGQFAEYSSPPESPIRVHKGHARKRSNSAGGANSLTNSSKRALDALSYGAKRILTGTGHVSVGDRIEALEGSSRNNSPTKDDAPMAEILPRRVSSSGAAFLRQRQGARDWDETQAEQSGTVRRRAGRMIDDEGSMRSIDDDWDVETAVQQRVVQVMFTVPKEKLRVVNADNISMISRTDTNASRASGKGLVHNLEEETEIGDGNTNTATLPSQAMLHPDAAKDKGKQRALSRTTSLSSVVTIGKAI